MAFRGETAQIPLTNIFQTLSLSSQKGVLGFGWQNATRRFRFLGGSVRIIPDKPGDVEPLRSMLIKLKILTETQFTNVLESLPPNRLLGDALLEQRVLTPEEVVGPLRSQCEELLLSTFRRSDAKFHFTVSEGSDTDEVFSPEKFGRQLSFEVTGLLIEAARRQDEWTRIHHLISDPHEIVLPSSRAEFVARLGKLDLPDGLADELIQLIDGENDLKGIVQASRYSEFQVLQPIAQLLEATVLTPLPTDKKKELADRHRRQFRLDEAATILRSVVKENGDDIEARRSLASILTRQRETEELLTHWRYLAKHAQESGDHHEAKNYLLKILAQAPEDLPCRATLCTIYRETGKNREALDMARRLVQAARMHDDPAYARSFVEKCIDEFPDELSFQHALAALCFQAGDREGALQVLGSLANHYRKTGATGSLRRTYEQMVKIDPKASRKLTHLLERERRQRQDFMASLRRLLLRCAGIAILTCFIVLAFREIGAHRCLALKRPEIQNLIKEGRFDEARNLLEEISNAYPITTIKFLLRKDHAKINEEAKLAELRIARLRDEQRLAHESRITRAEFLFTKGKWEEAWHLISQVPIEDAGELDTESRTRALALRKKFREYREAAISLANRARVAEEEKQWREAFLLWKELLDEYPDAPQARNVRLPLQVVTTPPHSEVWLDDTFMGLSPLVIRWSPAKPSDLEIRRKWHQSYRTMLSQADRTGWTLPVSLPRLASWEYVCEGVVEAGATVMGTVVFVADRGGKVTAIDAATGLERWQTNLGDINGVSADLRMWNDNVICLTLGGTLVILSPNGAVRAQRQFSFKGRTKLAPTPPTDDGIISVVAETGELCAYSIADGAMLWSTRLPAKVQATPVLQNRTVTVGDVTGNLWKLNLDTGALTSKWLFEKPITLPPIPISETEMVGVLGRELVLFDDEVRRRVPLPAAPTVPIHAHGDRLYVATNDDHLVALDRQKLNFLWKVRLPRTCSALAGRQRVVYAACGSHIVCVDRDGKNMWRFTGNGPIISLAQPTDEYLVAGCDDRRVYLFLLDGNN